MQLIASIRRRAARLGVLIVALAPGTYLAEAPGTSHGAPLLPAIPNARVPLDGVLSGGQPTEGQVEAAAGDGFRTVINLRPDAEPGFAWEREAVTRAGMRYVQIPIAGADDLTRDNVKRVDAALREALDRGPVVLHCASGNRVGAVLALRAAWLGGTKPEEALGIGEAAGLTRLEPAVRGLLGLPGAPRERQSSGP